MELVNNTEFWYSFEKGDRKQEITLFIMILAFCQDLSLGIFPFGESKTMTAEVTLTTAGGGEPNDFSSVKFACWKNKGFAENVQL